MSLSLRHLRYFVAAAETGQVSRAAVELNVSQSAVTGAIRQIETRIGTRLFERHSTGVTLTFEGSRFLQHESRAAREIEAGEMKRRERRSKARSSPGETGGVDA